MDLLSPTSAFRFPMPGGDCQSLQRHRSTSTPNVHMVSTVGPVGVSIIEVSVGCLVHILFGCYSYEDPIVSTVQCITTEQINSVSYCLLFTADQLFDTIFNTTP